MPATRVEAKEGPAAAPLLQYLARVRSALTPAEERVAAHVLSAPQALLGAPLAQTALDAGVSEPTVIRFCRTLGCSGFQDFKLRLAQSLGGGTPYVHASVRRGDGAAVLAAKICHQAAQALLQLPGTLDHAALERAIGLLARASRIEFYGQGNSGIVAQDAQHKFFRLGVPTAAWSDPHVHSMAASLLDERAVVVAFSASGRTLDLLGSVQLARDAGASVVAITATPSPLAAASSVAIRVAVDEDTDVYTPMSMRLVMLTIVDLLAVGVALRRGPNLTARLEHSKASLAAKKLPACE